MKPEQELKILKEYINIIERPEEKQRKYSRWAMIFLAVSFICIFTCYKIYSACYAPYWHLIVIGFIGGFFLTLAFWFGQLSMQLELMAKYMNGKSIKARLNEINT